MWLVYRVASPVTELSHGIHEHLCESIHPHWRGLV